MIDASMLLHMILALDMLEKLIPGEEAAQCAVKIRDWESLSKGCCAEYRSREKGLGF